MKVLLLVCCLAALAGCGAVGDPLPPLLDIPKPPVSLAAVQRGSQMQLTWPAPTLTTEGVAPRVDRVAPVKIYRLVLSDPAATAKDADFKNALELKSQPPTETLFTEPVDPAWYKHTVVYTVKYANRRGETAGFSNFAVAHVLPVAPAPTLKSQLTEKQINITWSALAGTSYRVYRDGAAIGDTTGDATDGKFADTTFEFDHTYTYIVRAVNATVESEDSAPAIVKAVDIFPPLIPEGLRAIAVEDGPTKGIDLSWTPNTEADLAGYNVYRGTTKLNATLLQNTLYRDVTPGTAPKYRITAVDTHGNESKPSVEAQP